MAAASTASSSFVVIMVGPDVLLIPALCRSAICSLRTPLIPALHSKTLGSGRPYLLAWQILSALTPSSSERPCRPYRFGLALTTTKLPHSSANADGCESLGSERQTCWHCADSSQDMREMSVLHDCGSLRNFAGEALWSDGRARAGMLRCRELAVA